MIRGDPIARKL